MAALEQQWYLYSSVYIKLLLPHKSLEQQRGFELGVNEKVPGVKLPARLQANPVCRNKHFICAPHVSPTRPQ